MTTNDALTNLREAWSEDGLTLTLTATYAGGAEADISTTWKSQQAAELNADKARAASMQALRERRFDNPGRPGSFKRQIAKRLGPVRVGVGYGFAWKWIPEFALNRGIGLRWANGYLTIAPAARRGKR